MASITKAAPTIAECIRRELLDNPLSGILDLEQWRRYTEPTLRDAGVFEGLAPINRIQFGGLIRSVAEAHARK